jgi:hypothetical protein
MGHRKKYALSRSQKGEGVRIVLFKSAQMSEMEVENEQDTQ